MIVMLMVGLETCYMTIMRHILVKDSRRRSQRQPQRRIMRCEAAQKPLHGYTKVSQLDGIGCLMALKSQFNLSRDAFDSMLTIFGSMLPEHHILPKTMYQAQKILGALKMLYEQIHSCPNRCVLFKKKYEADETNAYCPKCKASRFLEVDCSDGHPKRQLTIPVKSYGTFRSYPGSNDST